MIKELIDLSYLIETGTPAFIADWHPPIKVDIMGTLETVGRATRRIQLGTHSATHMDAPAHFIKNGGSIDTLDLKRFIGPVSILNFSHLKENESVTVAHLEKMPLEKRLIFKFGWGRHWKSPKFFRDYPFVSQDAAKFLVEKKIDLLGMDTPSPDDSRLDIKGPNRGSKTDSPVHKILLGAGVILAEYLANLDRLTDEQGWTLIAMPLNIKDGDGAPSRICVYR